MRSYRLTVALLAFLSIAAPAQAAQVTGLETNATATPLGIDDATPQLRWRLESDQRARRRRAIASSWPRPRPRRPRARATSGTPARSRLRPNRWTTRARRWPRARGTTGACVPSSEWAAPTWFETAYLSPAEWKGDWISGPAPHRAPLTLAQAMADDACCLQGNSTLFTAAAAGDRIVRVANVAGFGPGQTVTLGGDETADDRDRRHGAGEHHGGARTGGRRHEPEGRVGHQLRPRRAADDRHADRDDRRRRHRRGRRDDAVRSRRRRRDQHQGRRASTASSSASRRWSTARSERSAPSARRAAPRRWPRPPRPATRTSRSRASPASWPATR